MDKIIPFESCTGCRACEQICPKNAITMKENEEGFLYPSIDKDKCINCGLCKKTCPILNYDKKINEQHVFGLKPCDGTIAKNSTSGGAFYLIAKKVIQKGGIVVGAAYDFDLYLKHTVVNDINELEKLRGSKYVISDTNDTFKKTKELLIKGTMVLYAGCPCQIAGLKSYLKKDYHNLITIDLICHGVPSYKLFRKYLDYMEIKLSDKIINYKFRSKEKNWWGLGYTASIELPNKELYIKSASDPYYSAFLSCKTFRESCYNCKFANLNRSGDITLGDFWGIEYLDNKMYSKLGVSLVLTNTSKGLEIIKELEDIVIKEYPITYATRDNKNLESPSKRPKIRDEVYKKLDELDFEILSKRYLLPKNKIKNVIKSLIPQNIKLIMKSKRK